MTVQALDQRIVEDLEVSARLPHARRHDHRGVEPDDVVAELDDRTPPGVLDVPLQLDAERAIVPRRTESAVDLG